jgi:isopenicillin N synthase-like dioxygenase
MPLGGEGTHGRVDHKEGVYFGPEHADDHPLLGMPLHGKNQFPSEDQVPGMRAAVLEYIAEVTKVGVAVVAGLSLGLGLEAGYLKARCSNRSRSRCFAASNTLPASSLRVNKSTA